MARLGTAAAAGENRDALKEVARILREDVYGVGPALICFRPNQSNAFLARVDTDAVELVVHPAAPDELASEQQRFKSFSEFFQAVSSGKTAQEGRKKGKFTKASTASYYSPYTFCTVRITSASAPRPSFERFKRKLMAEAVILAFVGEAAHSGCLCGHSHYRGGSPGRILPGKAYVGVERLQNCRGEHQP